jgi:hypothetical protein
MTTRRTPRPRSPRNALLFIHEEARAVLSDLDTKSYTDLVTALVRVERLALEALYPAGEIPTENVQ